MSMRTYGVQTKGMVVTLNDFQVLLSLNKGTINKDLFENVDNVDFSEVIDFSYLINNACFIGEFEGYLETDLMEDRTYYNGDDIILLELQKDTLYEKYNDRTEIIAELKNNLKEVGIIVDDDYINKHFGYVNGSYFA